LIPSLSGDTAKLTTLKAAIVADGALAALPNTADGNQAIAEAFNLTASPDFWAYKRIPVQIKDVGDNMNGAEMAGLSSLNHTRLLTVVTLSAYGGVDPSKPDRRQFFDDIFSGAGGAITRANLAVLWRRLVTRAERLYTTGTGSTGSPGSLANHSALTRDEVEDARNLP
jgi:hypothetical protein